MLMNPIQSDPVSSTTSTGSIRSQLVLPEILGLIFSFLPPGQVVISVSLVCKLWHAVVTTQNPIIRTACWSETTGFPCQQDEFTQRLFVAQVVQCKFPDEGIYAVRETLLKASARLRGSFKELEEKAKSNSGDSPTRSLTVEGVFEKDFVNRMVVPFGNIRTLTLWRWNNHAAGAVPLDTILEGFRHLRVLQVSVSKSDHPSNVEKAIRFHGHGLDSSLLLQQGSINSTNLNRIHDATDTNAIFGLESLTLAGLNASAHSAVLLPLIRHCPALQDLRVYGWASPSLSQTPLVDQPYDQNPVQQLIQAAKATCPKIRYIYLSDMELRGKTLPFDRVFEMILTAWPEGVVVGIPARVIYPIFVGFEWKVHWDKVLHFPYMSQVTTLDLLGEKGIKESEESVSRALHRFLCDSPQLLHLRAKTCPLWLNLPKESWNAGDGAGGGDEGFLQEEAAPWKQVWACRGLRTLHFEVYSGPQRVPPEDKNSLSRSWFAYLSIVVPKIQDLWIQQSTAHQPFIFDLEGGLCLLSEMKDLQSLTIFSPPMPWTARMQRELVRSKVMAFQATAQRDLGWIGPRTGITEATVAQLRYGNGKGAKEVGGSGSTSGVVDRLRAWYHGPGPSHPPETNRATATPYTMQPLSLEDTTDEGIVARIESRRTLNGVADTLERLRISSQLMGCWPSLEHIYLSLDTEPPFPSMFTTAIREIRPELRYSHS